MEWISIKDRLPEDNQNVLFIEKDSQVPISGWFDKKETNKHQQWNEHCNCGGYEREDKLYQQEVTHWMPLPSPPKD